VSVKRSGLGRGLDALLPKAERGIQQLPLNALHPSRLQPRKRFDPAAIAELTASIAEKGVLQPLLVRPSERGYEIVAGERRFRAAKQAGLTTVPAIVRELDDRQTLEVAIIENLQREDLNPLEEARAFKELSEFGMTQEAIAKAVGKSRSAVANALRLLSLPKAALAALERGDISAGHARAILAKPAEVQEQALAIVLAKGLSVRQAEALTVSTAKRPRRSASDGRYRALESELARHVGTRVTIAGGKKGKIELHFFSEDELERLLELLGYRG
jgi:ParB family chromosome partitioning protein